MNNQLLESFVLNKVEKYIIHESTNIKYFNFVLPNKNKVKIEVNLNKNKNGEYIFSASGTETTPRGKYISGGQILYNLYSDLKSDKTFMIIYKIWKEYHLNDLQPGTQKQMYALKKVNLLNTNKYSEAVEYLKSIDLYIDKLPNGEDYKYGTKWLVKPIPEKTIKIIQKLLK